MKFLSVITLVFVVLISCGGEVEPIKPSVLLNKQDMVSVLVDVQLLESHYHNKFQRPNVYANALDSATQLVFTQHGISKQIFKDNLSYYSLNQDSLFKMYESALDTVNNRINSNIER
jgi:ABC-type phosphate transport system ATPase subunit